MFRRVAVYCGSSTGRDPAYLDAARSFGAYLAGRGIGVVYGGGRVGLMGAVADGALSRSGEVIGIIPEKLKALELGHDGITELRVVDSMHERKLAMAQLSDGFVALPGGFGTFEEIFEVTTWTQLNYHHKPVGLLNVGGYYDRLIAFLDHAAEEGFIRGLHRGLMVANSDPDRLLDTMASILIPDLTRWIERP